MEARLDGRNALITGGSAGIGKAIARRFLTSGANVSIVARRSEVLKAAKAEIEAEGAITGTSGKVIALSADIRNSEECELVISKTQAAFGHIDVLVNNAGTSQRGDFLKVSDEIWQDDLDLKLFSAVRLCRLVIPGMRSRKWGRIINVLNLGAKVPNGGGAPTAVSRAAGMALTKVLAKENAGFNILVNGLLVGRIRSEQWERRHAADTRGLSLEEWYEDAAKQLNIERFGTAEEFANMATFLASDAGSYINGTAINVDGGSCPVV